MGNAMKNIKSVYMVKCSYLIFSMCLCVFGGILIFLPEIQFPILVRGAGILFILFGAAHIWGHFVKDLYRLAFQHGLATGIFFVAVGIFLLFTKHITADSLCIILGVVFLTDALSNVEMSIDARSFGIEKWWAILIPGLITGVIGFILIPHPFGTGDTMVTILGWALTTVGILNLLVTLLTLQMPTRTHPEKANMEEESPWGL